MATLMCCNSLYRKVKLIKSFYPASYYSLCIYNDCGNRQQNLVGAIYPKSESRLWRRANLFINRAFHQSSSRLGEIVPFKLSDIGEGIAEVVIKEWFVKEGDVVQQFDNICEVQSDKASVTITSRYDGTVRKIHYEIDDIAKVGLPLVEIELNEEASGSPESPGEEVLDQDAIAVTVLDDFRLPVHKVLCTPAVRRLAAEHSIRLSDVSGTGKQGRVMKEDILSYINKKKMKSLSPEKEVTQPVMPKLSLEPEIKVPLPVSKVLHSVGEDYLIPIKGFKKAMVKSMVAAQAVPHFGYCDEIDMTSLVRLRKDLKSVAKHYNISLTFMPFFMKAASLALLQFPILNSSIDSKLENIICKASHNIGIAMDTNEGLIVPNVKNVQNLSIIEIASELSRLQQFREKANFSTQDITGGTITLSNIGSIGGTYAKPVLLLPEVLIGAIGKIQTLPRYCKDGNIIPVDVMQISWSADHRILDGATVARFSNLWKSYLESPARMLTHMR